MSLLNYSLEDVIHGNISNNSVEVLIEKIYKLNGTERKEVNCNELVLTKEDSNLIELDIVINKP